MPGIGELHENPSMVAALGRGDDDRLGHLAPGEIVIPKSAQSPALVTMYQQAMRRKGFDPMQHIVGSDKNKVNPKTELPEFADPGVPLFSDVQGAIQPGLSSVQTAQPRTQQTQTQDFTDYGQEGGEEIMWTPSATAPPDQQVSGPAGVTAVSTQAGVSYDDASGGGGFDLGIGDIVSGANNLTKFADIGGGIGGLFGGGTGAVSGIAADFGSGIGGLSTAADVGLGGLSNIFGGGGMAGGGFMSSLGGAGIGFGIGQMTGSPIAGAASGAIAGFMMGGPVGAVIGGLGGLLGGFMGGKPSVGPNANTGIGFKDGRAYVGNTGSDNGGDGSIASGMASNVVSDFNSFLDKSGATYESSKNTYINVGYFPKHGGAYGIVSDGSGRAYEDGGKSPGGNHSGEDLGAAENDTVLRMIKDATFSGLDTEQLDIIHNYDGDSVSGLLSQLRSAGHENTADESILYTPRPLEEYFT